MRLAKNNPTLAETWNCVESHGCGDAGPVEVFVVCYLGRVQTPPHVHEWDSLHWIIQGRVSESYDGDARQAGPGDLLLYRAGVRHTTHVMERSRIVHLPFYGRRVTSRLGSERLVSQPGSDVFAQIMRVLGATAGALRSTERRHREGNRLVAIIESFEAPHEDRVANHAAELLVRADRSSTLDDLAAACGKSRWQLARRFRAAFGCSVGTMLHRHQVAEAARLLLSSDRSLSSVAVGAGFCDQSHLGRIFKRHTGVTPLRFRRLYDYRDLV